MKRKLLGFLAALCLTAIGARTQTFVEASSGLPTTPPFGTSIADFDADGKMDLLCFDGGTTNFLPNLYRYTGTGFTKVKSFLGNDQGLTTSFWADDNGDGLLDLMINGQDDLRQRVVMIYRQNADHTFATTHDLVPGGASGWIDLDNDGRLDIITGGGILWKEGDGAYTSATLPLNTAVTYAGDAIWDAIDLDGDGDLDLLLTNGAVFRNDGGRHFVDTGLRLGAPVTIADMDGDGQPDVISNKTNPNGVVVLGGFFGDRTPPVYYTDVPLVFYNRGGLRFETNSVYTATVYYKAAGAGDFDGDGKTDLITISPPLGLGFRPVVFTNSGNGFLSATNITFANNANEAYAVMLADFDGDGDLDMLGIPNSDSRRRFFRNTSNKTRPVAAPKSLHATARGDGVTFSWEPDSANAATFFNLRVGTAPGSNDVVASMSQPNGQRLIPRRGNIVGTHWRMHGLKPGIYYWSAQAVDASMVGSPFADEQSFTITGESTAPQPEISTIPNVFTDEDTPAEVNFTIGPESVLNDLTVTVESSAPLMTPVTNLEIVGTGTNRTLRILPATNVNGTATITLRVTDGLGQIATNTFVLTVFPVNDPPSIDPIPDQVVYNNAGTIVIPYDAEDVESTGRTTGTVLKLTATSSDQTILTNSAIVIGPSISRTPPIQIGAGINITVPTNKVGSVTILVTADDGQATASTSFVLLILPPLFQDIGQTLATNVTAAITWADFNNDGRVDFLKGGAYNSPPSLFLNTGTNRFQASNFVFTDAFIGEIGVADLNNDNYLDLVTVSSGMLRVHLNDKGTNFITASTNAFAFWNGARVSFGDLNNDGLVDVLVTGTNPTNGTSSSRVFKNTGGALQSVTVSFPTGVPTWTITDIDGDGWNDAMFFSYDAASGASNSGVYRHDSSSFLKAEAGANTWVPRNWTKMADINGDGLPDVMSAATHSLLVYTNTGGRFAPISIPIADIITTLNGVGDFDGDGLLDFICGIGGSTSNRLTLVHNNGDWTVDVLKNSLGPIQGGVQPVDINNDGALDLALLKTVGSTTPPSLRVLTNATRQLNAPPGMPRGLKAEVHDNGMILSWTAPTDLNQSGGFSYNVRVGTQPGASDVVSPLSLAGGKRLVVASGNAGGRMFMILTNLTAETYYWSVQAIDNSNAGGPFAPEQRVAAPLPGNLPPVVSIDSLNYIGGEDIPAQLALTVSDDHSALAELKLRAYALDPTLIPFNFISITGTGATRTLRFHSATNKFGQTDLLLVTTDAVGAATTNTISVTLTNVNDAPRISAIPSLFSDGPGDPVSAQFNFSDIDDAPETLQFNVTTTDSATLPSANISIVRTGTNATLSLFTSSSMPAIVGVTVEVGDLGGATATSSFSVSFTNRFFKPIANQLPGVRSGSMSWGDFDDDRDLDLLLYGDGMINSALYVNNGAGQLTRAALTLPASYGNWLDYDRDGDLDFLYGGATILTNESGSLHQISGFFGASGGALFADFDNDGDLDALRTLDAGGLVRSQLYENTNGAFTQRPDPFGSFYYAPRKVEDFNQDGFPDIYTAKYQDSWIPQLFVQRTNSFVMAPLPWPGDLKAWADFDNDGLPDALVDWDYYSPINDGITGLTLLKNVDGKFGSVRLPVFGGHAWTVAVADFDNDGFLDIFVNTSDANYNYFVKLFRNKGDGTFEEVQHPFPAGSSLDFSFADVDNDGALDVMLTGQPSSGAYFSTVFRNHQSRTNQPPAAPQGLRANNTADGLLIQWDEAHDPNQTGGLTYNLALGTAPGKWDIIAPMSRADGWRKIVGKGNVGWLRWKSVRGLEGGKTYYYSVQAIDNSYAGGPFAPEQSITILTPPAIVQPALADAATTVSFMITGETGITYVIESSTDLKTWNEVQRIDNPSSQIRIAVGQENSRFLRVRGL